MTFLTMPAPGTGNIQTGPNRPFNDPFLLSADHPGFVAYVIESTSDFSQVARVQLLCEALETPTIAVASTKQAASALLGLVNIQGTSRQALITWVPAGFYVMLDSSLTVGSPTITLVDQLEVIFHDA